MLSRSPQAHVVRSLDHRRWIERDVIYGTVVATANPNAEHWVLLPGASEPIFAGSTTGRVSYRPGSIVPLLSQSGEPGLVIAGLPAPGRKGAADFPLVTPSPDLADPWGILRAVPAVLQVGVADQPVTIYGFNFSAGDSFRPVAWGGTDWTDDPEVAVHDVVITSPQEAVAAVDVASGRPLGGYITLQPWRVWEI